MLFETSQFGKVAIRLSVGFWVVTNLTTVALPALAQQNKELEEVCRNVVLGSVYTQKAPLKLEVSFAKYGDIYFKDSADANVKLVVSYSADFTSPSDDPYTSPVQLPPGMSWSSYSAQGACGFGSDGRLIAIRIKRTNIWRSSKDFKDYGKVQDLGQLIVFGQGVKASESDSTVKTFNVIANGKKEKWVANC